MTIKCPKCKADNPDTKQFCGDCGTQLPSQEDNAVTETVEAPKEELTTGSAFAKRYQIIEELGKGGMGRVYKANDTKIKERIAIKLIKPEIAKDKKTIERFSNELRLARKIRHKNICQMFDLGEDKGTHFITMEFVPGEDLKSMIRMSGHLAVGTTISIAKQICDGLEEAHKLGVVHRDLKPNNVMIDKDGNVRIMDFGIARSMEGKGITGSGVMIGTPEYMSPEQVEGKKEIDQRSDIYSLGVILYEMVTGRVPFEGETPISVAVKHKTEIPKKPTEFNNQIPGDLSRVILKCLEKEEGKRYQSAGEVRSELTNIEKEIPTTDRAIPKRKPITSKEIPVTLGLKKLLIPASVVVALAIIAVAIWQLLLQKEAVSTFSSKPSIAILPFEDLSPMKDQAYFCDGLAEELINRLTTLEKLKVPARTSSFSFKDKELSIQEIGKELNVEAILEGSVRKAGNKLRVTVQLINVADGYPLWSEKYEHDEKDVFVLQDEISLAILDNLKIKLLGEEKTKLVKHHTKSPLAYNLYLQGRFCWKKRTEDGLKKAIEYFEKALESDNNYALAYVGIADSYNMLASYYIISSHDAFPEAKTAVRKALEIDNTLAEAYSTLAYIEHRYDWSWSDSEKNFRRAIQLNSSYAPAYQWYATLLRDMGRFDEALAVNKRALELDPLSLPVIASLGSHYYFARKYDLAIEQCKKTIELDSNFFWAHAILARAYLQKTLYKEAITEFQEAVSLSEGSLEHLSELTHAYAVAGKRDEALKVFQELNELSQEKYLSPLRLAEIYTGLGDKEKAIECLEKAYIEHDSCLSFLGIEPKFDDLRSNPRFKTLLKKIGLE